MEDMRIRHGGSMDIRIGLFITGTDHETFV